MNDPRLELEELRRLDELQAKAGNVGGDEYLPQTLEIAGKDTGIPLPKSVAAGLVGAGKSTARIMQGVQQLFGGNSPQLAAQVAEENKLYAPLAAAHPWATGIGEGAPAMAVPMGGAGSVLGGVAKAALANAIPGALEYGTPEERAKQAAIGGAGGAAGGLLGAGLGRFITPVRSANPLATDEVRAIADAAKIKLTPAQATGSKPLQSLDATLATFPGSAGVMAKIQQGQGEGFNRAAMGLLGEPPTSSIANDAATLAKQGIGSRIEGAAAGVNIPVDMPLLDSLAKVEAKYAKNLTPDQRPIVGQYINDILNQGPTFDGKAYQAWRARIGARAQSTQDSELKSALKGVQGALDDAFDRAAPAAQSKAMDAARGQYRNFKTLEPLLQKAAMGASNIPPAQVASRALATKNFTPEMQNLAQLGQTLKDYPNSGTTPRLFWQTILSNPAQLLNPFLMVGAPAAYGVAKAIHNPLSRKYLTNEAMTPELEALLIRGGGLLGYGGARGAGQ